MRKPTAIDLFAGAGGLTAGLKLAGFRVSAAVELDRRASETFRANHRRVHLEQCDIRAVRCAPLMRKIGLNKGELDLLAGCPPCQGFSRLPTRNGMVREGDERNDLVFEFVRFVRSFHPKAIMFENVPGLMRNERFQQVEEQLRALGYVLDAKVLDAADYGVPQHRRRLILLGTRGRRRLSLAEPCQQHGTVRDALAALTAERGSSGDALHNLPVRHSDQVQALIRSIPEDGGSRMALPEELKLECHKHTNGFHDVYGRMRWDAPSPTITSGCINPSKGRFLHPTEHRAITLREAAVLQGFPLDYVFFPKHGKEAITAMIGNALPPPFIAAHARSVREALAP
ncbi:MAG: DNA cytosine methyltransferase [Myxococcota bacterium]|nr:DNA cytosine methyltransferase [Myxococcota bacterium]